MEVKVRKTLLFARADVTTQTYYSGDSGNASTCLAVERVHCARLHHEWTPENHEHNQCYFDHGWIDPSYSCHRSWCRWRSIGVGCNSGGWSHCSWLGPSAEHHSKEAWDTCLKYSSLRWRQLLPYFCAFLVDVNIPLGWSLIKYLPTFFLNSIIAFQY